MLNDKIYLTSINQSHHIDHNSDQYEEAGHDGEGEEAAEAGAGQQRAGRGGEAEHVAQGAGHRHQPGHRQGGRRGEEQHGGEGSWGCHNGIGELRCGSQEQTAAMGTRSCWWVRY